MSADAWMQTQAQLKAARDQIATLKRCWVAADTARIDAEQRELRLSAELAAARTEVARLQQECDSMVAPEELRQWKAEAAQLRAALQAMLIAAAEDDRSALLEAAMRDALHILGESSGNVAAKGE